MLQDPAVIVCRKTSGVELLVTYDRPKGSGVLKPQCGNLLLGVRVGWHANDRRAAEQGRSDLIDQPVFQLRHGELLRDPGVLDGAATGQGHDQDPNNQARHTGKTLPLPKGS